MLVLKSELTDKILRLQKTQIRRSIQPGKAGAQPRCRFAPGALEALARRLRPSELTEQERVRVDRYNEPWPTVMVGTIEISAVRREQLGNITTEDARREGCASIGEFKRRWVRQKSARWIGNRPDISNTELEERFDRRWASQEVWVITFSVVATPLLLAADPRRSGDYVTAEHDLRGNRVSMADEREAVDPSIIDSWATDANSAHRRIQAEIAAGGKTAADQRELDRELLGQEERIKRARDAALLSNINVSSELRAFNAAKAKHRAPERVEERVRALESKAYREGTRNAA